MTRQELALLPPDTLVSTNDLTAAFGITPRTITRMIRTGRLPPAIRIGGTNTWLAGRVMKHIKQLADDRASDVHSRAQRIRQAMP